MKKVLKTISKNFEPNTPATASSIEAIENYYHVKLPSDYKHFLQFTNGLEGSIGENYLVLWSAEELIQLNEAYNVKEFVSNIIIIGSNGADEAFAFYTADMSIVNLPFIDMGHIVRKKLADTFEKFLASQINHDRHFFKRIFG